MASNLYSGTPDSENIPEVEHREEQEGRSGSPASHPPLQDAGPSSSCSNLSRVQFSATNLSTEIPAGTSYKQFAEQWQAALKESLDVNLELQKQLDCLKEEHAHLSEVAAQAEYLAKVVEEKVDREDALVDSSSQTD
ncbi:hypothetical protein BV898_04606 [Hypsibius exemplaris]|uniref:Uncharacterized protein n=1 Tax=Hypsibius exemplaris TaxID=2072580 RepID=A0A1W0X1L8_HYPEX|nr:hypothetical protein BV898_04606 [Hypsibius exemplaris]